MRLNVINLQAEKVKEIEINDKILEFPIREDLVLRDVLRIQSNRRQPYGADPNAGLRTSAEYHGRRRPFRAYVTQMGRGMARHQRIHGKAPLHMIFVARISSNVRKGMRAHAPTSEKIWEQKINKKEKRLAILSAAIATLIKDFVLKRGHKIEEVKYFPIVIANEEIEKIKKAKDFKEFLVKIGLEKELERIHERKIRAGKGKMRGRRYKKRAGILLVVENEEKAKKLRKVLKNLNIFVTSFNNLNSEILAPGAKIGRLTIWQENALKLLENKILSY
ncbi:MAG: 50S ribosomal protein L4 [Candidatus Aenigmatarchaeota archaeon]